MQSSDPGQPRRGTAFDAIAHAYELLVNEEARWDRERPFLLRWLDDVRLHRSAPPRILDAGCGTGFHARHLAQRFDDVYVVGADPSREMLEIAARKRGGDLVQWMHATAERPPAGPFDLVLLLGNTLSLIESIHDVLEHTASVVEPGGLFIIQMLDYASLRAAGLDPRVTERADDRAGIRKELTPRPASDGLNDARAIAADLQITVFVSSGNALATERHALYEHPESTWLPRARAIGWSLVERRSRYDEAKGDDESPGPDRIFVLRRQ